MPQGSPRVDVGARPWWRRIPPGLVVAVAIPTLLFGWVSLRALPQFDGALNLQVAQSLAEDGSYARYYEFTPRAGGAEPTKEWEREHPSEVQTNGPFIFVSAVGFKLFGTGSLAVGFSNVAFIALLAGAVWWLFRPWRWFAAVAPITLLLLLPTPFKNALGGLGEIPALSLVVLGLALLGSAVRTTDDVLALRKISLGLVAASLAVVTKTYMLGAAPAFVATLALIWWSRRDWLAPIARRVPLALVGPALFELYRLINLGPSGYRAWWSQQATAVSYQAGVNPTQSGRFNREEMTLLGKVKSHLLDFADIVNVSTVALVALVAVVGVAAVVVGWWWIRDGARPAEDPPADPIASAAAVSALSFSVMAGTYLAWWLLLVPDRKLFPRRTYPGWLALALALMLFGCLLYRAWVTRRDAQGLPRVPSLVPVVAAGVLILAAVWTVDGNGEIQERLDSSTEHQDDVEEAARALRDLEPEHDLYGIGWFFSAPVLSLLSEAELHNLTVADPCTIDPDRALLVWDHVGPRKRGSVPEQLTGMYEYEDPIPLGSTASAHRIVPLESACPS